jgi:hypothetical protein
MRKTINIWAETIHDSKHGEQIRVTWERDEISLELHLNTPGEVRMLAEYVANTEAANVELYDIDADGTIIVEPLSPHTLVSKIRSYLFCDVD